MEQHDLKNLPVGEWIRLMLDDATCAYEHPYPLWLKKGSSDHLVVYLDGGGVAWDLATSAQPMMPNVWENGKVGVYKHNPLDMPGPEYFINNDIRMGFRATTPDNPFVDWSMAFIGYGTGDFHVGAGDVHLTDLTGTERDVHHHGYLNFKVSMKRILEAFPHPDKILICGESGGAFGVPAVAGDVIDAYPDCKDVTVFSDSATLAWEGWPKAARELWQAPAHIADVLHSDNLVTDWFEALYQKHGDGVAAGKSIKYLYSCGATDHVLAAYQNYVQGRWAGADEADLAYFKGVLTKQVMDMKSTNPAMGVYIHEFMKGQVGPGVQHCMIGGSLLVEGQTDGVTPARWLLDAMDGKVYDVGLHALDL